MATAAYVPARRLSVLGWLTTVLMVFSLWGIFLHAPLEKYMREVQKIFYVHVGTAWNAALAFTVVLVASLAYLRTRNQKWDVLAQASAEVGLLFTSMVLITGPIWSRHSWNVWWNWEPRLTSTLVLWFIYVAYFFVRAGIAERSRRAVISAVFGIIGFVDVPIVYFSVRWWRLSHPIIFGAQGGGLETRMLHALLITLAAFTALYLYLTARVMAIENAHEAVQRLKLRMRDMLASGGCSHDQVGVSNVGVQRGLVHDLRVHPLPGTAPDKNQPGTGRAPGVSGEAQRGEAR